LCSRQWPKALSSWWITQSGLGCSDWKMLPCFRGHSEPVRAAVFSSDGLHAVSGSVDGPSAVDVESGNCLHVLPSEGHCGFVDCPVFRRNQPSLQGTVHASCLHLLKNCCTDCRRVRSYDRLWDATSSQRTGARNRTHRPSADVTENSSALSQWISGTSTEANYWVGSYPVVRLLGRGGFERFFSAPSRPGTSSRRKSAQSEPGQGDILRWLSARPKPGTNLGLHPHIAYCSTCTPYDNIPLLCRRIVPGGTLLDICDARTIGGKPSARASVDLDSAMCTR